MALFLFDIFGSEYLLDHVGTDLPDMEAANEHAVRIAATFLRLPDPHPSEAAWIVIKDAQGIVLDKLRFERSSNDR